MTTTPEPLLLLKRPREPLSPEARRAGEESVVIDSPARQRLAREIERYVAGDITGRAFLVSGAAGAGKTTMVLSAIERAATRCAEHGRRPLPVRLSAPALVESLEAPPSTAQSSPEPAAKQENKRLMMLLAQALAKATADAFLDRFELAAGDDDRLRDTVAELRVALEGAPTFDELQSVWRQFGVARDGVLFDASRRRQGIRELGALWHTLRVHQVVTGQLTVKTENDQTDTDKTEAKQELSPQPSKLYDATIALFAGAAVGGGAAAEGEFGLAGVLALGGTLLANAVLKYTRTTSVERKRALTYDFEPTLSLASLSRLLPALAEQLRTIGLAPVFVVDDLDRAGEAGLVERTVGRLKSYFTDQAFFVFLGEPPADGERNGYSDTLFLAYRPEHVRAYLDRVVHPGRPQADDDMDVDAERALVNYALLLRSSLRMSNLHAELDGLCAGDDVLVANAPRTRPRDWPAIGAEVFLQLVIEQVLGDDALAQRLAHDDRFAHAAIELLYRLADRWRAEVQVPGTPEDLLTDLRQGAPPLQRSSDERLLRDMVKEALRLLTVRGALAAQAHHAGVSQSVLGVLPPVMLAVTSEGALAWQIDPNGRPAAGTWAPEAAPPEAADEVTEAAVSVPVSRSPERATRSISDDALRPAGAAMGAPRPDPSLHPAGAAMGASPPVETPRPAAPQRAVRPAPRALIASPAAQSFDAVREGLLAATDGKVRLPDWEQKVGGLPGAPRLEAVEAAVEAVREGALRPADERLIERYVAHLTTRRPLIARALVCAAALRGVARAAKHPDADNWHWALGVVSAGLRFRSDPLETVLQRLDCRALLDHLGLRDDAGLAGLRDPEGLTWSDLAATLPTLEQEAHNRADGLTENPWPDFRQRTLALLQGEAVPPADLGALFALVARRGPYAHLEWVSERHPGIGACSAALLELLDTERTADTGWLVGALLCALGFPNRVADLATDVPDSDPLAQLAAKQPAPRARALAAWTTSLQAAPPPGRAVLSLRPSDAAALQTAARTTVVLLHADCVVQHADATPDHAAAVAGLARDGAPVEVCASWRAAAEWLETR
ncbi:MAG: hypothetical protein H6704_15625 [Myxococcales bacterium]|nr:hypothetical protein [Myxococcales bacterium]